MHIDHKAGAKMFVGYAGKKLAVTDPKSGIEKAVETFVAILSASELSYVRVTENQGSESWVMSNYRAIRFFQGVPAPAG
jgi:transposase